MKCGLCGGDRSVKEIKGKYISFGFICVVCQARQWKCSEKDAVKRRKKLEKMGDLLAIPFAKIAKHKKAGQSKDLATEESQVIDLVARQYLEGNATLQDFKQAVGRWFFKMKEEVGV